MGDPDAGTDPLARFSGPVREWFASSFPEPTGAQAGAWGPISRGEHTLLCAPTGSGNTKAGEGFMAIQSVRQQTTTQ